MYEKIIEDSALISMVFKGRELDVEISEKTFACVTVLGGREDKKKPQYLQDLEH